MLMMQKACCGTHTNSKLTFDLKVFGDENLSDEQL